MKETFHLSDLDKRIISEIQQDATLSAAELARRTASSSATCWRRIKAMEEAGVLGPTVRLVNPTAVGRGMDAFCNVRMKSQDATSRRAFLRAMEQEQAITFDNSFLDILYYSILMILSIITYGAFEVMAPKSEISHLKK